MVATYISEIMWPDIKIFMIMFTNGNNIFH